MYAIVLKDPKDKIHILDSSEYEKLLFARFINLIMDVSKAEFTNSPQDICENRIYKVYKNKRAKKKDKPLWYMTIEYVCKDPREENII